MASVGAAFLAFFEYLAQIPGAISRSWRSGYESAGGFLTATLIGWALELIYGLATQGLLGGLAVFCLLWFASGAAFFVGTITGVLFGIPRVKTESGGSNDLSVPASPLTQDLTYKLIAAYKDNTNLEEVSDWLTKIIIGIGLAEFRPIINFLGQMGDRVGAAVDPTHEHGGDVIALGSMIVGFATGFLYYYHWARVVLRRILVRAIETSSMSKAP